MMVNKNKIPLYIKLLLPFYEEKTSVDDNIGMTTVVKYKKVFGKTIVLDKVVKYKKVEKKNKPVPEGMVRTVDGKIIKREDAVFLLREHPKNKNLLIDSNNVVYVKDKSGTLRRYPPKDGLSKKERIAERRKAKKGW